MSGARGSAGDVGKVAMSTRPSEQVGAVRVTYEEVTCKSALNRVHAPSMPFRWSLNPTRSCAHGCPYCYARSYHDWLEIDPDTGFNTRILIKTNLPEVLRRELARPGWTRELVAIGTAVDPYQPVEGRYKITRRCLEALLEADTPVSITTKNTMVWRDVDLLVQLAQGPGCVVNVSITTLDPQLARKIEPGTSPPHRRLEVVARLVEAGVPAGVMLAPILPGITDRGDLLAAVVKGAYEHNALFLHTAILRLEGSTRDVYLRFLQREFPHLLPRYERLYALASVPGRELQERIDMLMRALLQRYPVGSFPGAERLRRLLPKAKAEERAASGRPEGGPPGDSPARSQGRKGPSDTFQLSLPFV